MGRGPDVVFDGAEVVVATGCGGFELLDAVPVGVVAVVVVVGAAVLVVEGLGATIVAVGAPTVLAVPVVLPVPVFAGLADEFAAPFWP